ncbi:cytochrome b561 [Rhizobiales bacterium GAS188]|nr:cytochrome b561 [Rhizobiales bacterium GAS188]
MRDLTKAPTGYTALQKSLHWATVLMIALQWWTSGAVLRTHEFHPLGHRPDPADLFLHKVHIYGGVAVLGLVGARLFLRWRHGTPLPPPMLSARVASLARSAHVILYAVLTGLVLTGLITTYFWFGMGRVHKGLVTVLYVMVTVHVGAVIWHDFVQRIGLLRRMLPQWRRWSSPPTRLPRDDA